MTPLDALLIAVFGIAFLILTPLLLIIVVCYALFGSPESGRDKLREFVRSCR